MSEWRVPTGAVTVDGTADEPVWSRATGGVVGAHSDKTTRVKAAWNEEGLFLQYWIV